MPPTNRIAEVYRALGLILNNPASFGLAYCTPKPLVDALTTARHMLMEELFEESRRPEEEEDFLAAELSQDADTRVVTVKKENRI